MTRSLFAELSGHYHKRRASQPSVRVYGQAQMLYASVLLAAEASAAKNADLKRLHDQLHQREQAVGVLSQLASSVFTVRKGRLRGMDFRGIESLCSLTFLQ